MHVCSNYNAPSEDVMPQTCCFPLNFSCSYSQLYVREEEKLSGDNLSLFKVLLSAWRRKNIIKCRLKLGWRRKNAENFNFPTSSSGSLHLTSKVIAVIAWTSKSTMFLFVVALLNFLSSLKDFFLRFSLMILQELKSIRSKIISLSKLSFFATEYFYCKT